MVGGGGESFGGPSAVRRGTDALVGVREASLTGLSRPLRLDGTANTATCHRAQVEIPQSTKIRS